jgi:glycosyltransferase involved in cell wall biosynthesis
MESTPGIARLAEQAPTADALISVIVPAFNERESLQPLFDEIQAALGHRRHEVVFVDDGSTDGSRQVMLKLAEEHDHVRVVKFHRNFGKSAAYAAGFRECHGDIVITLDGDLQDDPAGIPDFLARLDDGLDLVCGWKRRRHDPISKTFPSRVFNAITSTATGIPLHDFNCGFKAYRRELVDELSIYGELHRFIPALAYWKGFRVGEVEVNHRPRIHGSSKFGARRFLSGMMDLVTVLFLTRFNRRPLHLFGSAGLASFFVGLVVNAYLSVLWLQGQPIGTRPLLLLGVLLMVIGLQFFALGLLADLLNVTSSRSPTRDHRYSVWPPSQAGDNRAT